VSRTRRALPVAQACSLLYRRFSTCKGNAFTIRPTNPANRWNAHFASRLPGFTFLCLALFLFTGCVRNERRADLVIINGAEPESLDPAILTGQADMRAAGALFEGLCRLSAKTSGPEPGLTQSWDISPDGRIYTFHLRTNLQWSTGEPITADDVVYSWLRVLNPDTASDYAGQLYYLKNGEEYNTKKITDPSLVGVHALDKHTVKVELNHPTAFFLDLCCFCTLYVVPRQAIEKYGDRWIIAKPLPVSGPFELVEWKLNDKIRVRKNPRYWDAANTKSGLVDLISNNSANTALNIYETGRADIVWDKALVPNALLDVLLKRPDFHASRILATFFIRFNVNKAPFNDVRVRKALALAVDKSRITSKITRAGEEPADALTPPGTARYTAPKGLGHDPGLARKLLAEAGYPGGKGLPRFQYMFPTTSRQRAEIGVEIQQMWRDELGVEIELRPTEWKVYLASQSTLDFEISDSTWVGDYNDPDTFLNMFFADNGNNRTGWKSVRYDELIKLGERENDPAQRERYYQDAETMLVRDEVPIIPVYFFVGISYYNTRVQGIYPSMIDMHPINTVWKAPASQPGGE
jgi:oligopeptide transport system substrate-binding protein